MPMMICSTAAFTWACFSPRKVGWSDLMDGPKILPMGALSKYSLVALWSSGLSCAGMVLGRLPPSLNASSCASGLVR